MATEKEEIKTTLLNCLSQQVSEMELFKSMYPNDNEITLDGDIMVTINKFLDGESEYVPKHIDFMLRIQVNDYKLEISINLPSFYPIELPEVYVRCNQLNRQQETSLNTDLLKFIKENHNNEVYLLTIISWILEQVDGLQILKIDMENTEPVDSLTGNNNFARMWIFSHHIYNKKKREEIVKLAKELNISGFCLSGKPGIICIEGNEVNCKEWWKVIKSLTWKKIGIRKTEIFNEAERQKQQKFHDFEEIHFQNPSSKHSKHANMSEFSKYIENHGLSHAFNEIFGLSD